MKRHQGRRPAKAPAGSDSKVEFNQMIHLKMIEESERHFSIIEDLALVDGDSGDKITAYARDVIAATDIVLGAYPNQEAAEGVAMWVIKGRRAIVAIYQDGRRDQFCAETCRWDQYSITAIPCLTLEMAVHADAFFGDGTWLEEWGPRPAVDEWYPRPTGGLNS